MSQTTCMTFAFPGAPESLHNEGIGEIHRVIGKITSPSGAKPFILLFLSGGSEAEAIKYLDPENFQILLGSSRSNAFASATEVKAYSMQRACKNILLNLDDKDDQHLLRRYILINDGLQRLRGKRLGLIGEVSEWLVASDIHEEVLKKKLGVDLFRISWGEAGSYRDHFPVNDFFSGGAESLKLSIADAGRVSALLESVISINKLDAITVECFSLVKENQVTACLGLSYLNDRGLPAGCEGDLCSVAGIMLVSEILGDIPWMANVAGITGNTVLFAHCTAPRSILADYVIDTHYETGAGTAIRGRVEAEEVTVFRVNNTLDRFFISKGKVIQRPYEKDACRTQLYVELPEEKIREMRTAPLGNHHLILRGDKTLELGMLRTFFS